MNFGLNKYDAPCATQEGHLGMLNANATPRTLREQLNDQIAYHKAKIADLDAAVDALTPDVEKALNALQKL